MDGCGDDLLPPALCRRYGYQTEQRRHQVDSEQARTTDKNLNTLHAVALRLKDAIHEGTDKDQADADTEGHNGCPGRFAGRQWKRGILLV